MGHHCHPAMKDAGWEGEKTCGDGRDSRGRLTAREQTRPKAPCAPYLSFHTIFVYLGSLMLVSLWLSFKKSKFLCTLDSLTEEILPFSGPIFGAINQYCRRTDLQKFSVQWPLPSLQF